MNRPMRITMMLALFVWLIPIVLAVAPARAHTVSTMKVTQVWPGPIFAFACTNKTETIVIEKQCTAAQYEAIINHGGVGAFVSFNDGDPTLPAPGDGSDGDTKDVSPHMESVAVSATSGGPVTVVNASQ